MTEALINNARNLLCFFIDTEVITMLVEKGITRENAFLAVKAAEILLGDNIAIN